MKAARKIEILAELLKEQLEHHPGVTAGYCNVCHHYGDDCTAHSARAALEATDTNDWRDSEEWKEILRNSRNREFDAAMARLPAKGEQP